MSTNHRYADRPGRQDRAMESAPGPTRGEPGEFRADARKQRKILDEMREGMARGEWTPAALARARRGSTGRS